MGVINRAVLQGEIMQALNALFANGQVGRTETHKIVIFPETTVSFSEELNAHVLPNCVLVEGKEYSVTFNGETSHPTASKVEENGSYYIEISNLVDGDGYQVMYVPSIGSTGLLVMKGGAYTGDVTISITTKDKTIHPIDPKYLPEGGVGHTDIKQTVIVPKQTAEFVENEGIYVLPLEGFLLTPGAEYSVMWDGKEHRCICATESGMPYIGNMAVAGGPNDTGEPFCATCMDGNGGIITSESGTHSFSIVQIEKTIHVIASQYIMPEIDLSDYVNTISIGSVEVTDETVVSALNQAIEKNAFILARIGCGVGGFTYYILTKVWNSNKIGFEVSNGALAVSVFKDINGSEWTCHTANI